jgi:ABC-type Mn2+/Zn2+ transport system permease subunit/Mn-dependent DtxR family transcriptional regulator
MEQWVEFFEVFRYAYAQRALAASVMVGITCGILGCFIMLRNMAMIGDALSHAILPGVVGGFVIGGYSLMAFFGGSVIAGLTAAVLITLIQRNVRTKPDSAIGIVFTAMFALGVMGISYLSNNQGVHLDMKGFLFGNILGISNSDIFLTLLIGLFVVFCIIMFYRFFFLTTFEPSIAQTLGISSSTIHYFLMALLSFTVVASLQSVGVILVVAMLIIPASTAYLLSNKLHTILWLAGLVGLIAAVSGLLAAIALDTTPGPAMTINAAILYGLAAIAAPERGLYVRWRNRLRRQRKIRDEDVLKGIFKLREQHELGWTNLQSYTGFSDRQVKRSLRRLKQAGLLQSKTHSLEPTAEGIQHATWLVRAHRMWETYQAQKMGLTKDQVHPGAERYEHFLSEEQLQALAGELGDPQRDPHGKPIPKGKESRGTELRLSELEQNEEASISLDQPDEQTAVALWRVGLTPNLSFNYQGRANGHFLLKVGPQQMELDAELAERIKVHRHAKQ